MQRLGSAALSVLAVLMVLGSCANAEVKLPSLISDNMMLQQHVNLPIWGTAAPKEHVKVTIGKQSVSTIAGTNGLWMVRLKPLTAGGPLTMTVAGKNKLTVRNILVGEVWLCAGQSNMVMTVKQSNNAAREIADAKNYPQIRYYDVKRRASSEPMTDTVGKWVICSPETAGKFSAAGYFFGRDIHKTLKVPVGLILSAWGGSNMEAFVRLDVLRSHPESAAYFKYWEQRKAAFPAELAAAKKKAAEAKAAGKPAPTMRTLEGHQARPASIYNGMISPLIPFAMRGVVWAGGKANRGRAKEYGVLMPAMIQDWRKSWGLGDFPFFLCQMANYIPANPNEHWEELREAMLRTTNLKNTGMVVCIDIGDPHNVHPKAKQEVGRRLALIAKSQAYGMKVSYSGPVYESMNVQVNAVKLYFKHVDGGLVAGGGGPLKGFVISGANRRFVPAQAVVSGDTIIVTSDKVSNPAAVRYAWEMNPDCNLTNKSGLPASPFRTDTWPRKPSPGDTGQTDTESE
jgi:sialate O-acetylesterase